MVKYSVTYWDEIDRKTCISGGLAEGDAKEAIDHINNWYGKGNIDSYTLSLFDSSDDGIISFDELDEIRTAEDN